MLQEIILASIVYIIYNFAFTYFWNIILLKEKYESLAQAISREEPIIPLGLIAIFLEAVAMAILFDKFYNANTGLGGALVIAFLVGIFSILYGALVVPAKFKIEPISNYIVIELFHGIIQFTGISILFVLVF